MPRLRGEHRQDTKISPGFAKRRARQVYYPYRECMILPTVPALGQQFPGT